MTAGRITELRLTAFKSYRDVVLPLSPHLPGLSDLAGQRVGAGDAAILHERRRFEERVDVPSGQPVRIWTYDKGLRAHA